MHRRRLAASVAVLGALILHLHASWWMARALSLIEPRSHRMDRMQASFTRSIEVGAAPAALVSVAKPSVPALSAAAAQEATQAAEEAASSARAKREAAHRRAKEAARVRAGLAAQEAAAASASGASAPARARASAPEAAVEPPASAISPLDKEALAGAAPVSASASSAAASASAANPAIASPAAAALAAGRNAERPVPFQWPASTRIRYRLVGNYRGEVNGSAQVTWLREGERYQVHLEVFIGPSFAPLVTRRMSSEGIVTAGGLSPRRYEQETRQLFSSPRLATLHFDAQGITLANGKRVAPVADVQDTASQFIQMIYLFTTRPELRAAGGSVEIGLALPNRADRWLYDVGPLALEHTPMGDLEAFNVRPRRAAAGGDLAVEIWFAPRLEMLPIRFRIRQDADTYVDLFLEQAPQQANP